MVLSLWRKLRQRGYEVCPRSHRHRSGGAGSIHSKLHAFCIFPLVVLTPWESLHPSLGIPIRSVTSGLSDSHLRVDGEHPLVLDLLFLGLMNQWLVASDRHSMDSLSHLYKEARLSARQLWTYPHPLTSLYLPPTPLCCCAGILREAVPGKVPAHPARRPVLATPCLVPAEPTPVTPVLSVL